MKEDLENRVLNVQNGYNGNLSVLEDFFKYSHVLQEQILGEIVLPLLYDAKSVHISIGYKN